VTGVQTCALPILCSLLASCGSFGKKEIVLTPYMPAPPEVLMTPPKELKTIKEKQDAPTS
jgi:hypothetical protein